MFYGTLIFPQSSMICIGRPVGGHALALQHVIIMIDCSKKTIVSWLLNFGDRVLLKSAVNNLIIHFNSC